MRRLLILPLTAWIACASSPTTDDAAIDAHVAALQPLELPPERPEAEIACDALCDVALPSDQACELQRFSGLSHEEQLVSLASQPALWPGSWLRGDAAAEGQLSPIALPRAPMTISVSLENLDGTPATTVQAPSPSTFRTAQRDLLAQGLSGSAAAYVSFSIERIHSRSQLKAELKAQASVDDETSASFEGTYDFDGDASMTRVLVDFSQAYYTVDVDLPPRPSDFLAETVTLSEVQTATGDAPPMVVQSVTYGRRILFAVATERSFTEVQRSLGAAMKGWLDGDLDLEDEAKEILTSASITGLIIGGSAEDAAGAISIDDLDDIQTLVEKGGAYGADNPGAPIGYRLAYLDGSPARLAFATDYVTSDCRPNAAPVTASLERIARVDAMSEEAVQGRVDLRVPVEGAALVSCGEGGALFPILELDAQQDQFITVPAGTGWLPPTPPAVTAEEVALSGDPIICLEVELHERNGGPIGTATLPIRLEDWGGTHVVNLFGPGGRHTEVEIAIDY